jgi:hypothetical protein
MRSLDEGALGEVAEELVVEEGTADEGGMEFVLVADVGVVEMAELGLLWDDEVARLVFVEGGEVTCECWCCDEVDGVGGCCWF